MKRLFHYFAIIFGRFINHFFYLFSGQIYCLLLEFEFFSRFVVFFKLAVQFWVLCVDDFLWAVIKIVLNSYYEWDQSLIDRKLCGWGRLNGSLKMKMSRIYWRWGSNPSCDITGLFAIIFFYFTIRCGARRVQACA